MEAETKITSAEKVKDPRRVAQGKRLAAISREAKARKAEERQRAKECVDDSNMVYLAVGVTAVAGLTYGAYRYLNTTKDVKEGSHPKVEEPTNRVSKLERLQRT